MTSAQNDFVVCIDSYEHGVPCGRLFRNRAGDECHAFRSLVQLLFEMERQMDATDSPQAYMARRMFAAISPSELPPAENIRRGTRGTFTVRILYRQNASWQGIVRWQEEQCEQRFRSVWELIGLMDSALAGNMTSVPARCAQ